MAVRQSVRIALARATELFRRRRLDAERDEEFQFHLDKEIGSLEEGKKADVILLTLDTPNAVPMYDIYAQLAYALKASNVETVIIGGRIVMRDQRLLTINEQEAIAKAREYRKVIAKSLGMTE